MKKLIALIAILLSHPAYALGGGGSIPAPCSATQPSQASSASLNTLAMCNSFATNQGVDVNNTELPGYLFYVCETDTGYNCAKPDYYSNDGTGLVISKTNTAAHNYSLLTVGRSASPPYWIGRPLKGQSFYAEITGKFSRVQPTSDNSWPAFWGGEGMYSLNGSFVPANWPFMEIDYMECFHQGMGFNCQLNQQLHVWADIGGNGVNECSFAGGYNPSATIPTTSNYNTYGIRFLMPADNAGVIEFDFYVNNVLTNSCTEVDGSGVASCTYSNQATGANGGYGSGCSSTYDLSPMKTTDFTFLVGGAYQWPMTMKNFHVWTK